MKPLLLKRLLSRARKFVLIRTDRVGELLLTTPAIRTLKENFPDASFDIVVNPRSREAVEGNPYVHSILEFDPAGKKTLFDLARLARLFSRYDVSIIFNPSKVFNIVTYLARIPLRVGYDRKWGFLLNHTIADLKYRADKHEIEYNLDLVRALGISAVSHEVIFPVSGKARTHLEGYLQDRRMPALYDVLVHPFASTPQKCWPRENIIALLRLLIEKGYKVGVVGGKDFAIEARAIRKEFPDRALADFVGELPLQEFGALLEKTKVLVSGDSGPVHIASALGRRSVVLFCDHSAPVRWGPYGGGSQVIRKTRLSEITPEEVFDRIEKTMSERA